MDSAIPKGDRIVHAHARTEPESEIFVD